MENDWTFDLHPSEESLEEYCFNRLSAAGTAAVEEHLLICGFCQETLESLDEYILLMKLATAEYHHPCPSTPATHPWEEGRAEAIKQIFAWNAVWLLTAGLAGAMALASLRGSPVYDLASVVASNLR